MPAGFVAGAFAAEDDDGLLIVTLGAPSIEDEDFYLMLQHQDEYDEQDVELGMDQPYIEYCGQGWSWYGHIVSFDLHRDHVRVQMDAQAAREMDNDGLLEVRFDLADAQFHALRLALRFAEEQATQLAEQVYRCFERAGAYGRFKSLLERYGRLQGWYDFEAAATEQALREWAAENGITPVERPL